MNANDSGLGAEAAEIARLSAEYDALFLANAGYPHPLDDEQDFEDVLAKAARIAKGDFDEARRLIEIAARFQVDELERDRFLNVVKRALGAGARLAALRKIWDEAAREARIRATLASLLNKAKPKDDPAVRLEDFVAYMQSHDYIYMPAGDFWPAARVDARLPPVKLFDKNGNPIIDQKTGAQKKKLASKWLAKYAPVEQMTWAPGLPQLVRDKLIGDGGWIDRKGATVFTLSATRQKLGHGPTTSGGSIPTRRTTSSSFSPIACSGRKRRSTTDSSSAAFRASARTPCSSPSNAR
jgi:hypothetical protein